MPPPTREPQLASDPPEESTFQALSRWIRDSLIPSAARAFRDHLHSFPGVIRGELRAKSYTEATKPAAADAGIAAIIISTDAATPPQMSDGSAWIGLGGGGGGDNIRVTTGGPTAATDVDLHDTNPAAPAGDLNVKWQIDTTTSPDQISAYVDVSVLEPLVTIGNLTGTLGIAKGGTGQTTAVAAFDALAPTTTQGDLIYHNGSDNVRLAKGTVAQYLRMNSGATAPEWDTVQRSKSITVEDPTNAEDISIFFTPVAITVAEMRAVLIGSASPSVTWTIRHHATDRSNAGNEVVTSGTTTTSTTSGSDVTSFNDATIPADSFVWLETTAKSGTVDELHVTIVFEVD